VHATSEGLECSCELDGLPALVPVCLTIAVLTRNPCQTGQASVSKQGVWGCFHAGKVSQYHLQYGESLCCVADCAVWVLQ